MADGLNWKRFSLPRILLLWDANWKGRYLQVVYLDFYSDSFLQRYKRYTMGRYRKPYHSNILAISGTGRNVGKTTLTCGIIKKLGIDQKPTAVKISPHFHSVDYDNSFPKSMKLSQFIRKIEAIERKTVQKCLLPGRIRYFTYRLRIAT